DFFDHADAAAVGQKYFASDRLEIVELAGLGGRDILRREHHDRAFERLCRAYVGDTLERDSSRRRVQPRHSSQPKLACFSRAFQEHARDLFQSVGVGIVGPQSQRALEAVGAGYAADAEHRWCNLTRITVRAPGRLSSRAVHERYRPTPVLRSFVLDDLENNLAVGARGDRIQNRAYRLRGPPLLADH